MIDRMPEIGFTIPADFVWSRVRLHLEDVACGFRMGWLNREGVVSLCLMAVREGVDDPLFQELAFLLREELCRVDEILGSRQADCRTSDRKAVWLYLSLAWLHENREKVNEPLEVVEALYSDFDHPEALEGFVRYMPAPAGAEVGEAAMLARWRSYLDEQAERYSWKEAREL
ncbi:DUF2247 family protein [Streptosporangium saharense]|uniref:DUF2247 family protein n=1 Tax=Streptosporangium saharense TaxID=1706840 RepID=UPI003445A86E